MNYKHLRQIEKYQIYSVMKVNKTIIQIGDQLGRHKSTISRKLARKEGRRGYRPKQTCELALSRSQVSLNVRELEPCVKREADFCSVCGGALSRSRTNCL
jgi:IS30 family transposase